MQVSEMRVSEAIGRTLAERGVEVCFGLAGSGTFSVLNALHAAGVAFYSSRHECGAVAMADGYVRASGKFAVASVHPRAHKHRSKGALRTLWGRVCHQSDRSAQGG